MTCAGGQSVRHDWTYRLWSSTWFTINQINSRCGRLPGHLGAVVFVPQQTSICDVAVCCERIMKTKTWNCILPAKIWSLSTACMWERVYCVMLEPAWGQNILRRRKIEIYSLSLSKNYAVSEFKPHHVLHQGRGVDLLLRAAWIVRYRWRTAKSVKFILKNSTFI